MPGFVGLYQANAQSPRSLTGRGEGGGVLTVDGETANRWNGMLLYDM
ncbi:MAG TPA: hypothetical protein VG324_09920 [Blastocatellia bacterium]|nr:hypothetical protein [Blastocatellia bacterium]